jgi:hypothetical protein
LASISTEVPVRSPLSQSRTFSLPVATTLSPFEIDEALLIASCLKEVIVNQLVSPSTQAFLVLS